MSSNQSKLRTLRLIWKVPCNFTWSIRSNLFVVTLVFSAFCGEVCGQGQKPSDALPTIETIVAHWEKHAGKIHSARFVWTKRQEMPRAVLASIPLAKKDAELPRINPEGIHVSQTTCTFVLDGERMRLEVRGEAPSRNSLTHLTPMERIFVFDGNTSTEYMAPVGQTKRPQAIVESAKNEVAEHPFVIPLLWNVRAHRLAEQTRGWELSWTRADQGDRVLVALSQPRPKGSTGQRRTFLVDPLMDYAIVRCRDTDVRSNKLNQQTDLFLVLDKTTGWIPTSWTVIESIGSKESSIIISKVSAYSINHATKDESAFQVSLPEGTLVINRDGKELTSSGFGTVVWLIGALAFLAIFLLLWVVRARVRAAGTGNNNNGDKKL